MFFCMGGQGLVWPPLALVTGLLSSHAGSSRAGSGALSSQLMADSLLPEARATLQAPHSLRLAVRAQPSHRVSLNLSPTPWRVPVPSPNICCNRGQQRSLWQPEVTALQPRWTLLGPLPHLPSIPSRAREAQEP